MPVGCQETKTKNLALYQADTIVSSDDSFSRVFLHTRRSIIEQGGRFRNQLLLIQFQGSIIIVPTFSRFHE